MTRMALFNEANPEWQFASLHDLLIACVGRSFGNAPETKIDDIRANRAKTAESVRSLLWLGSTHTVADIGSGCGFVGRAIAPHVRHLTCIDISPDFLRYCREELSQFNNVSYCLAKYAEFTNVKAGSLDACYATAVCIHFNYYDFCLYFAEVNRVLRNDGHFLFDFLNTELLNVRSSKSFSQHLRGYKRDRERYIFNLMHPVSLSTIESLADQFEFRVSRIQFVRGFPTTIIVLQKTGPAAPIELLPPMPQ